jgi:signal transduction histidine kinase
MKWLSSWWVRLQRSAWPTAALVLLSIQAFLTLAPIRGESTHVLVDYSPLLFVATAVAVLNAAEPARNAVLFWSLLSAATSLWLIDLWLRIRFHLEFPLGFRLLTTLTAVVLLAFFFFSERNRRKLAERAQRESQERLYLAAQAGKMYAYEWDAIRNVIVRSPECKGVLGDITRLEHDTFERMLARIDVQDRDRFARAIRNLSPKNNGCQISYRLARPDGSVIWLEESAQAFFDGGGKMQRVVGMVSDVTSKKQVELELADLSARFVTAQEQERTRIARELHDDLSQRLALVAVALENLGEHPPKTKAEITAAMHNMWYRISEISADIHHLSRQLHPSTLGLGLGAALRSLCGGVERQHGVKVRVTCDNVPDALPGDVALCFYRVAQEAISNIVKHSNVKEARLELTGNGDYLKLQITDHGTGFEYDPGHEHGLGLLSMRERLRLVGGTLTIQSGPQGTEVLASVQIQKKALTLSASNRS